MIAFESMHVLEGKKSGSHHMLTLKLDLNKACDQVKWEPFKAILEKMGFID